MPRDGSGIYSKPFPDAVSGTTIESTKYNGNVSDVALDLNTPRPIVAGGTGATSGPAALVNLGGEQAGQVVTNYDSFPFVGGSFTSAAGATSAPNAGNAFAGICYVANPSYMTLEAREFSGAAIGQKWVRQMKAGVWGAWVLQPGSVADLDAAYVNVAGDTMTGQLAISYGAPQLWLNKSGSGQYAMIVGSTGANVPRWSIIVGDAGAETGGSAGSDLSVMRYNDVGAPIATALLVSRQTGVATFYNTVVSSAANNPGFAAWNGTVGHGIYTGTDNSFYINRANIGGGAGANLLSISYADSALFTTGAIQCNGGKIVSYGAAPKLYAFDPGQGWGYGIYNDGNLRFSQFNNSGGVTAVIGTLSPTGDFSIPGTSNAAKFVIAAGTFGLFNTGGYNYCALASGTYVAQNTSDGALYLAAGNQQGFRVQADGNILMLAGHKPYMPGGGPWLDNSDARIKNVIGDYEHGLDEILALQPVRYTFKGNNTGPGQEPSSLAPGEEPKEGETPPPATVPYANSSHYTEAKGAKEFIGLIAQSVETVLPEMVSQHEAMIDGQPVSDLRTLDTGPLIFALINAVKTLAARVEALEAA